MILRPGEKFVIARGLGDHTDSETYYVQATVRNARTDELLATVNLSDRGDRRFSAEYQVPWDSSGLGIYIIVTTTIYTDSGYTTKAPGYQEEFNEYLVDERNNTSGPGGADVDYKKIRKIVSEEIEKIPEAPEPQPTDLSTVYSILGKISKQVADIIIPEPVKTDLSGIMSGLADIKRQVASLPEPEQVDFAPVLDQVEALADKWDSVINSTLQNVRQMVEQMQTDMEERMNAIAETKDRDERIRQIVGIVGEPQKQVEKPKKQQPWTRIGLPMQ